MLPLSRPPCTYIHTHTHHNILCSPTLVLLNPFYCVISISSGTTRNQGLHADSNLFWTQRRPVSPQPKIVPFSLSLLISFSLSFFLHCFLDWTYQLPSVKKKGSLLYCLQRLCVFRLNWGFFFLGRLHSVFGCCVYIVYHTTPYPSPLVFGGCYAAFLSLLLSPLVSSWLRLGYLFSTIELGRSLLLSGPLLQSLSSPGQSFEGLSILYPGSGLLPLSSPCCLLSLG